MKLRAIIVCMMAIIDISLANAQVPLVTPKKMTDFASQLQGIENKFATVPKVPLILLSDLREARPQMVMLRERDGQKCSYVGELKSSRGEKESARAPSTWSITITRKNCPDGLSSPTSLVVPLRNLDTEPGYPAGSTVTAFQVKDPKE